MAIGALNDYKLWPKVLPQLQATLNSYCNASTGFLAHQLMYGITLLAPNALGLCGAGRVQSFEARIEAAEALKLAGLAMKRQYDKSHTPMVFQPGDKVLLCLHKGYAIPKAISPKYSDQYAGPFTVLQRIGSLAYKLDLPESWRIHPVISVAHLERHLPDDDPFKRPTLDKPGPVQVEGQDEYEVEKIIAKRYHKTKSGRTKTQYVAKWLGYDDHENTWLDEKDLIHAQDLLKEFKDHHREGTAPQL